MFWFDRLQKGVLYRKENFKEAHIESFAKSINCTHLENIVKDGKMICKRCNANSDDVILEPETDWLLNRDETQRKQDMIIGGILI